jgi:hypothetical protein
MNDDEDDCSKVLSLSRKSAQGEVPNIANKVRTIDFTKEKPKKKVIRGKTGNAATC